MCFTQRRKGYVCYKLILFFNLLTILKMSVIFNSDEDMQSIASLMSVNNNSDIAPLDDFEDEDFSSNENSIKNTLNEVTQQVQQMTNSLSGSDVASTPLSSRCNDNIYKNIYDTQSNI